MTDEKSAERLVELATTDLNLFKAIALDIIKLYEKGKMRIVIAGPAFRVRWEETDAEIIRQKNGVDERVFSEVINSILWVFHIVCTGEVPEIMQELKRKNAAAADAVSEKVATIEKAIVEHPTIRTGFYAYTLSKIGFFEEINWSAELRCYHSRNKFVPQPYSPYPVGRVTLTAAMLLETDIKERSFGFDITPNDLGFLIESLQELKAVMLDLQHKKIVES
jgi:hypothetical protein